MPIDTKNEERFLANTLSLELDSTGKISAITGNFQIFFGITTESLLQKSFIEILAPKDQRALKDFLTHKSVLQSLLQVEILIGGKSRYAQIHLTKEANKAIANIHLLKQKASHKSLSNNTLSLVDSLREELNKSIKFLNQLGSTAKIGGWEVYLEDMSPVWSEETYHIHELPLNNTIDLKQAINFYYKDHRAIIQERVGSLINNGEEFDVKLKLITAKEKLIWVRVLGKRESRNGKPYKIYGVFQDITEQVEAEEILRESEERFRLIAENSSDLICTHEADGTYRYVSPSSEQLLGYKPSELIGKNPYEFFNEEDAEKVVKESHEAVLAGKNPIVQYRYRKANGEYIWLETISSPIFKQGRIDSIVTISRDITERRRREQALITEEKRLKMALKAAKMGIWEWHVKEEKIVWDENLEKLLGLKAGESVETFEDLNRYIHPEDLEDFQKFLKDFVKSGKKEWYIELRIIDKSGATRWINGYGEMYFNSKGVPMYMIGVSADITQKIIIEEELKKLALVAEKTDNAVVITDNAGKIEWVNKGFNQLTGYQLNEVLGMKPGDFLQGEATDKKAIQEMSHAIKNLQGVNVEIINYTKEKKSYWVAIDIQPVFAKDGSQKGFISLQRDISQRKKHERSMALQNDELLKTNKELDNFVYRISHDLRAPVSSSLGLIELVKSELAEKRITALNMERVSEYVDMLDRSMARMDGFIGDILDYSRNARIESELTEINLHDLINDIYQQYKFLNKEAHLVLLNRLDPEKIILSDALRLNIILSNLISNSFKFLDNSKEKSLLEVSAKWHTKKIEIIISDNGIGIEEELQDKIFEMFFRASNKASGSGLGLYIVKESLERIAGSIKMESKTREGTTFTLQIPLIKST